MGSLIGTPFGYIMSVLYNIVQNYGVTLVLFTILFRLLLVPVTIKTQKNTARQALLQPKLDKLRKQYGKDKARYQQEMMKLQQEEGFSPFSSCLPMIIQMVLLFGIIDVVYNPLKHILAIPIDLIQQGRIFLTENGIQSSSMAELKILNIMQGTDATASEELKQQLFSLFGSYSDQILNFKLDFLGLNMGQNPVWGWNLTIIIPLLSGITALLMSWMTMRYQKRNGMNQQAGSGMMNSMLFIMPIFSTWIAFSFPIGIGMYWMVGNVCMIVTNIFLYSIYTPEKMKMIVEQQKEKQKGKKKSRYSQLMEKSMSQKNNQDGKKIIVEAIDKTDETENDRTAAPSSQEVQLSNSQRIALARKRLAELYGEEEENKEENKE